MGHGKQKKKKPKKFDIREIGNTVKNLFRRNQQVKPINDFTESNLAASYRKFYLKKEEKPLEMKVRMIEASYDPKRSIIDDRSIRRCRALTPYKRSHSASRTVHDTEEYVEEGYNIFSALFEVNEPYPFSGNVLYPNPAAHKTVQGNFSQKNIPQMTRMSRHLNEQCTSMSFAAVVAAKKLPTTLWTPEMIDRLVVYGDRLHHRHLSDKRWKRGECERLCVDELQVHPHDTRSEWPVLVLPTKELHGIVKPATPEESEFLEMTNGLSLERAIKESFDSAADGCVLTIGDFSTAIIQDPIGRMCLFDSHQNNIVGRGSVIGRASLFQFDSLEHLIDNLRQKHGDNSDFNIVGLEVMPRKMVGE